MQQTATLTPEKLEAARGLHAALACLARSRDEQAWTDLLELAGSDILRVTRGVLGDHALADDAAQETLLRIRDHARRFSVPQGGDAEAAARSWIMRIACTTALQILRSRRRTLKREQDYGQTQRERATPPPQIDTEQAALVRAQLEQLPEEQRVPLVMHFMGGMEYAELAGQIGCPVATARTRVHRGLKTLRERLALCGLVIPVGGMGDLLQKDSSSGLRLDAGHLPGWRKLLTSTRRPMHAEQVVYGAASKGGGGLSLMAKLGLTALALCAGTAGIITLSSARSAEKTPKPQQAQTAPAAKDPDKPAPKAEVKVADTDADVRRKLANSISIDITNKPLPVLLEALSKASGVRIVLADELKDAQSRTANLQAENKPAKVLLDTICTVESLAWHVQNAVVVVGPKAGEGAIQDDSEVQAALTRKATFSFADTPLEEALEFMSGFAKVKISIAPAQAKKAKEVINLNVTDMELGLALDWIARLVDLEARIEKGAVVLDVPQKQPAAAEVGTALFKLEVDATARGAADVLTDISKIPNAKFAATTDALIALKDTKLNLGKSNARAVLTEVMKTGRFSFSHKNGQMTLDARTIPDWENAIRKSFQKKISFDFVDTEFADAISFINALTKANIIIDPEAVQQKPPVITLRVTDETIGVALKKILDLAGLAPDYRVQALFLTKKENLLFPVELTADPVPDAKPAPEKPAPPTDF
ncbi:MAG TPA: RNA polymerase sigma factor [Planctomycetota bacterium]|nr:RNA polymerase sigma factor [Planctomycetota bacterium]